MEAVVASVSCRSFSTPISSSSSVAADVDRRCPPSSAGSRVVCSQSLQKDFGRLHLRSSQFLSGTDIGASAPAAGATHGRNFSMAIRANAAQVLNDVASPTKEETTVVNVDLGDRSYPIYIGKGLLNEPELLQRHVHGKKVLVVTNTTVAPLYLSRVVAALKHGGNNVQVESVILEDGEQYKNMEVLMKVYDKAIVTRMDRRCTFIALGGGVIGDMCGYAAASYLRGVNFIQIPTTLMAQVDSSVGGKTGVNHPLGKNMIGAFYQPQCVLVDTDTLNTLPDRELASGVAEVIKYGLIRDAEFFKWQEENIDRILDRDTSALVYAVKRSCENKADVVAADEREGGVRATLNLGHTFGHAIETGTGYGNWLHGEAVAAGTIMSAHMSLKMGWIDDDLFKRIYNITARARLPLRPPGSMDVQLFEDIMAVDKKVADGLLRLILLKGPLGNCVFTGEYDVKALDDTLRHFCRA
ncbi:3-dehydroquinate synthase [Marchantia polymorpha subsp. ruderalis]|uniref:3-dehydroquinate synthase, chloroplastic n=1 Tax=Marchantia polymorpha TaxID=3197 RepID=A0A2R6X7P3_MARPO|nr:hypothetical protein MARPO_0031s0094 [Marchantia polymorpha]BBN01074.1 hypothetical protein Mp_2g04380 [Marchantia polymorpha subsp. ruderalis]|eukprot:PTQ42124.1 hypothetical protein MARPO_0031s0094 [Marchantia polymorpha]